jgi:hypothetical protein
MAFLAGSWRPAGWMGLSPESPKKEEGSLKEDSGHGAC